VKAFEVVVPAEELDVFESEEAERMKWLPVPPAGFLAVVTVFVLRPDYSSDDSWPGQSYGTQPVGISAVRGIRTAFATWSHQPTTENVEGFLRRHRPLVKRLADSIGVAQAPGKRDMFFGQTNPDEPRWIMELAHRS
jgi:hypothetical protein